MRERVTGYVGDHFLSTGREWAFIVAFIETTRECIWLDKVVTLGLEVVRYLMKCIFHMGILTIRSCRNTVFVMQFLS